MWWQILSLFTQGHSTAYLPLAEEGVLAVVVIG